MSTYVFIEQELWVLIWLKQFHVDQSEMFTKSSAHFLVHQSHPCYVRKTSGNTKYSYTERAYAS